MLKKLFVIGAAAASAGAAIGFVKGRAEFRTWGVDPVEKGRALPGDDLVAEAEAIDTRGIDLAAPPKDVWPWLVQMGYGRAGWYSYDQLDMNHPSADRIMPELQQLAVGDLMPTHPGGGFEVRILEPEQALVLYADRALMDAQKAAAPEGRETASANVQATGMALDKAMQGEFQASWAFVLEPTATGGTRLIERFRGRMEIPEGAPGSMRRNQKFAGTMLVFGLFVMVRRQLLGLRDRVEGRPITKAWFERFAPPTPASPATPA
jgi:proline iminopeptidase